MTVNSERNIYKTSGILNSNFFLRGERAYRASRVPLATRVTALKQLKKSTTLNLSSYHPCSWSLRSIFSVGRSGTGFYGFYPRGSFLYRS